MTRISSRRLSGLLVMLVGALLVVAGCGSSGNGATVTETEVVLPSQQQLPGLGDPSVTQQLQTTVAASNGAAAASSLMRPVNGATGVAPDDPVTLTVFAATLQSVTMTGNDGTTIAGTLAADHKSWTNTDRLNYNTTYKVTGTAASADGKPLAVGGTFTTVKPSKLMGVQFNIPDDHVVGIAAPIIITFLGQVANKAAVEKALTVTTSAGDKVAGNWAWMQDEDFQGFGYKQSQVHWRPTKSSGALSVGSGLPYWPAGTKVTVALNLKGVNMGGGIWGKEDVTHKFSIRPDARLTIADVSSFHLAVYENGAITHNYAVSYGAEAESGDATTNGPHVVQDMRPEYSMCNIGHGYCNVIEKWAVRINNNGEFIHENMNAAAAFGKANVSNGCVNMSNVDAPQYYNDSMFGDPVEVSHSTGAQMSPKDYIYDWIYSADQWHSLSALG